MAASRGGTPEFDKEKVSSLKLPEKEEGDGLVRKKKGTGQKRKTKRD